MDTNIYVASQIDAMMEKVNGKINALEQLLKQITLRLSHLDEQIDAQGVINQRIAFSLNRLRDELSACELPDPMDKL